MISVIFIVAICLAYLIGSLSFAVIISKIKKLDDPRTFGSGNPGATNMLRSGQKLSALLTLIGDSGKGWLVVFAALHLVPTHYFAPGVHSLLVASCALGVIFGHSWPIFFRFQGGKCVATALGVMLPLNVWLGLCVLAIWLVIILCTKISALAALIAAVCAPLLAMYWLDDSSYIATVFIIAIIVIRRHKSNIVNLLTHQEKPLR